MGEDVNKRFVLLVTTLASFITPFDGSSVNVALPSIGKEFSIDAVLLSWIASSYLLAAAIFLVPFGRIADIYGRKKIFLIGTAIFTVSSLLSALSISPAMLILSRILQGTGSAMIFGTGIAILTSVYPLGERGKALGINIAAVYIGLSLGPFLGGLLTQNYGWRSVFLVNVPLGLLLIISVLWKLKQEWAEAKGEDFDLIGSIIFGFTLALLMYGFSLLPMRMGLGFILLSIIGILIFIMWELKNTSPILNINLFQANTVFALSNLAALINYSATFAISFLLSLYLQYIKGFEPTEAGLILITAPLIQASFSPLAGKLSDRIEPRIVASTGMLITTIVLLLFTFLNEFTALKFIIVNLLFLGLSFALFASPNTNAIMSSVEKKFYGVASATLGTMRLTGQMFSMGIAMLVFALYIGREPIIPENYSLFLTSLQMVITIFSILCFFGIFASLARGRVR